MHAVLRGVKGKEGMVYTENYPRPEAPPAGSNKCIVEVRASAINPVDYKVSKSILGAVVGLDVAGVVVEVPGRTLSPKPLF